MAQFFAVPSSPRILLVKTSSLGDVIHNLPVVNDIVLRYPNAQIDWLVEEGFSALPKLHSRVHSVITVALRRWRSNLFSPGTWREYSAFRTSLSSQQFDFVIDSQGLLKSAFLMHYANGLRCGFDMNCAREPIASRFYQQTFFVSPLLHAVERNRLLVAQSLGYTIDTDPIYGITSPKIPRPTWLVDGSYAVLLHSTSRADKLWNEANWIALGYYLYKNNIRCILPWGSDSERLRSLRLATNIPGSLTPPKLNLNQAAALLGKACVVFGVDTGMAHLAAALNVPTVGIYTSTDPGLTGLYAASRVINLGGLSNKPDVNAVIDAFQQVGSC